ncbi:unnamed protein product [Chondrus crispus]|uniref:CCT domain-containing protein n=1 Tax=Chondrus crispus TaxID=2769 RepID=R7Q474_CHOCR|nr:unnamed protein product [Chondrus crispus]CDF32814.1 unnamed protein product [Chondrus crispus]|eukprot:XP_005712615.1 unnamed protein product [Chondrus crispus]
MQRINSETNLAVQLLLAVSGDRPIVKRTPKRFALPAASPHIYRSSPSSCSEPGETCSDSDATEPATSAVASPAIMKATSSPVALSKSHHGRGADSTLFRYTREERLQALKRFRDKKRRRQFQKKVRYMVRKRLAETRPRYKGRFSKPPPGENYDDGTPGPQAPTKAGQQQPKLPLPTKSS